MDVVITFVNGLDPVWQESYSKTTSRPILEKRFRDWGLLKYLMRGIETHMPFIRKVHLVVSGPSQVPDWVSDKVHVVYHSDFVPAEFLPTFNCNTLEAYLHRIDGLDEEYLYFNDDMFPVSDMVPEDFFQGDRFNIGFTRHYFYGGMYKYLIRISDRVARKALGMKPGLSFVRPQHICSPMFKSECEKMFCAVESTIRSYMTTVREKENINQYMYMDYLFYQGRATRKRIPSKHFSMAVYSAERIASKLQNIKAKIACINDVEMTDERFQNSKAVLIEAFSRKFPDKSAFEK